MEFPEEDKLRIVQDFLNQRYDAEHKMRQRSADFTKWILGLGIGLLWILLSKEHLTNIQKIITSLFVIFFTIGTLYFIAEICKGFKENRNVIIKLEKILGLYSHGIFIKDSSILPEKYQNINNVKFPSHFKSLYFLLIIICAFLLFVIIYNPTPEDNIKRPAQTTIKYYNKH